MNPVLVKTEASLPNRPLLQTKLCMPRVRGQIIPRPRLLEQLNATIGEDGTIQAKLTLVTAPAGYGKTTLITQWLEAQPTYAHAWLSLDNSDNDPARFLAYLFAAIATVQASSGDTALARLASTYIYNDAEAMVTALLNSLGTAAEQMVLVLDDYHVINNAAVHTIVDFLLHHLPPQLHLIITSRAEPPLAIPLLRGRRLLTHLTAAELRFDHEEAADFLQEIIGVELPQQEVIQLDYQVEGWVTGLQLVALALQENVELHSAFSGSQRYLVDYLGNQVLARQTPEIKAFLLHTAILEQFCGPLCDAVLGAEANHSQAVLEQLETANLFLIPLDAERRWYRYHHLFADFLRGRLTQQMTTAQINQLHQQAAQWYFAHNQALVAIDHALKGEDFETAVQMIAAVARQVLMFGEGNTLRQWVEMLPATYLTANTQLVLYYSWALIRTGEFQQANVLLEQISDQLDNAKLWGEWSALRARLAVMSGETDVNIRFSQKALAKLPTDHHNLRSEVAINLGFSHLQNAELDAARAAFAEAAQHTMHDPGLWSVMFATFYWGQTH
ncbi:MAG: AAA family ATPase, partial [Anaerolineales bacterium]|nr:AAA family ATPase [Anaerolineales bacterium]